MTNKEQELPVVKDLKTGEVIKYDKRTLELLHGDGMKFTEEYNHGTRLLPYPHRWKFKGKYYYFYKDLFSDTLIKTTPDEYDKRVEILKEEVDKLHLKTGFFIGFYVPYFEYDQSDDYVIGENNYEIFS